MFQIDLTSGGQLAIVLCELAEDVEFAVLLVDISHQIGVPRPQVDQLVPCLIQIFLKLIDDHLDVFFVDRCDLREQLEGMVAAHQVVLENVIDQLDFLVYPTVDEVSNAADALQLDP